MSDRRLSRSRFFALSFWVALGAVGLGCAGVRPAQPPGGGGGGGGGNSGGNDAAGGHAQPPRLDAGVIPDTAACTTRVACVQPSGQYCGTIGDGCNGSQDCGTCP